MKKEKRKRQLLHEEKADSCTTSKKVSRNGLTAVFLNALLEYIRFHKNLRHCVTRFLKFTLTKCLTIKIKKKKKEINARNIFGTARWAKQSLKCNWFICWVLNQIWTFKFTTAFQPLCMFCQPLLQSAWLTQLFVLGVNDFQKLTRIYFYY